MHMAIRLLNEHSLSVVSSNKQVLNGTIMVMDDVLGTRYTIHKSGYARKRVTGWCGVLNHYQLNKTRKVKRDYGYGEMEFTERILLPGEYLALAKMVVNAANRERKNADKNGQ